MKKFNKKGFTLIEMLVVIAIIAVLVAIIIPVVTNSTDKAAAATNAANLRAVKAEISTALLTGDTSKYETSYTDGVLTGIVNSDADIPKAKKCGACVKNADMYVAIDAEGNFDVYYGANSKYYSINAFSAVADGSSQEVAATELTNPVKISK